MQYPEHGIAREFAEISLAIEGVDGAEPLGDAAAVARELFGVPQELIHLDERHRLPFEINALLLVAQLHRVEVVRRTLEGIEELETHHVQVLERGEVARLFHVARKPCHVEDQSVAVQRIVVLVLDIDGNAVAGHAGAAVVGQEQVGFDAAVSQFAWNIRIHELRVLYAVRAHEVQRRVDEVGGKRQVLLASENLLDASVVVEIDVPVLVFLDDCIDILAVIVCGLEFLEKDCEFFSDHFIPKKRERARIADRERPHLLYRRFFGAKYA